MPQFDATSFPSQIFWLAVTFIVLYVVLARVALPRIARVLDERQRRISGDLEKAEQLRAEAEQVLADYEKAMADSRSRAQDVIRETKDELSVEAAKRERELAEKIRDSLEAAESRIAEARKDALANIREVAIEVAQAATERLAGTEVDREAAEAAVDSARGGRE